MAVCDLRTVSTISRMLHAGAAISTIILNVHWWSRARLCCIWKLPNLSWRPVSELKNTTVWKCKSRFYSVLARSRSGQTEDFYKEKR